MKSKYSYDFSNSNLNLNINNSCDNNLNYIPNGAIEDNGYDTGVRGPIGKTGDVSGDNKNTIERMCVYNRYGLCYNGLLNQIVLKGE